MLFPTSSPFFSLPKPKKGFLQKISSAFRKEPKTSSQSPPLPSSSPAAKQQRDAALRECGLLPPSNSSVGSDQQEPKQVSGLPEVLSNALELDDINAASTTRIKQECEEKNHPTEADQLTGFKFGGKPSTRSFVGPLAVKLTDETSNSTSPRKKAPTALKLDRARLGPLGPPPDRALPPSPSDPEYKMYLSQLPSTNPSYRPPQEPLSPQSAVSTSDHTESTSHHSPTFDATFIPRSLSPPTLFPISASSDESSCIATPSRHSSVYITDHSIQTAKADGIMGSHVPIIVEDYDGSPDTAWYGDEQEIDSDQPLHLTDVSGSSGRSDESFELMNLRSTTSQNVPFPATPRGRTTSSDTQQSLRSVNPTMHTPGSIAKAVAIVEDDETRRLMEVAFLS